MKNFETKYINLVSRRSNITTNQKRKKIKQTNVKTRGRPKGTGAQTVFQGLKEDILQLRLRPGKNIEEPILEKRYNVSRTPVREALIRLASEGLVTLLPNKGARVTEIDISDVPQYFEALDVSQRLILRLCAMRASERQVADMIKINDFFIKATKVRNIVEMSETNRDFHAVMLEACGNKYVSAAYAELLTVGLRLSLSAFGTGLSNISIDEGYYKEVIEHHRAMIDAISSRDADLAEEIARKHTSLFRRRIVDSIESGLSGELNLSS
jgi:DNA-binding GntR family transcriptional regulator